MRTLCLIVAVALASSILSATEPIGQDDIVVSLNDANFDNYLKYDASLDVWTYSDWTAPKPTQSTEFDNAGGVLHNASGNLLAANFGCCWDGFEIYNLATNGTDTYESVWSVVRETCGVQGEQVEPGWYTRGAGLSVSPNNTKVAWTSYDGVVYNPGGGLESLGASIFVLDYDAGSTIGQGSGVSIGGPRLAALGDGAGNPGTIPTMKIGAGQQGTTWLSDDVVIAANGYGEIVVWDVSNVAPGSDADCSQGTPMAPTLDAGWYMVADLGVVPSTVDVEYNPAVDPEHIFVGVTTTNWNSSVYCLNYNQDPANPVITPAWEIEIPDAASPLWGARETREIALDSQGNLIWSCYAGSSSCNIVAQLSDATDMSIWRCEGDANLDETTDDDDLSLLLANWGTGDEWALGDFSGDGQTNDDDLSLLLSNWQGVYVTPTIETLFYDCEPYSAWNGMDVAASTPWPVAQAIELKPVPEPATLTLLAIGAWALSKRQK